MTIITMFGLTCIMIRTLRHAEASDEQTILMSMQALEYRNDPDIKITTVETNK